jgi:hypothetical protein
VTPVQGGTESSGARLGEIGVPQLGASDLLSLLGQPLLARGPQAGQHSGQGQAQHCDENNCHRGVGPKEIAADFLALAAWLGHVWCQRIRRTAIAWRFAL